jgi:GTPase SAR1 family protein
MACPINPIIEECKRLRKAVRPISERYHGLTEQINSKNTMYPFVLLLGNHSSGKSSFINHILKRKVQTTGVAPTDDNFTIIGPGETDLDRNGPALIGDPDLGLSGLKAFGQVLVNHTQLKVRSNVAIKDFMVVDSPGMIDSPVTDKTPSAGPVGLDRGYNFEGVCRWYAERADVILLFFDPDKPGTTGETLSILTTALVGLDHKLYIILNKADQFHRIHDFARAYGSLCWNLSKVIPRKDLPRIHTMCLPAGRPALTIATDTTSDKTLAQGTDATASVASPQQMASPSPSPTMENTASIPASIGHAVPAGVRAIGGMGSSFVRVTSPEPTQRTANGGVETPHAAPLHRPASAVGQQKSFFEQGVHDLEESRYAACG